MSKLYVLRLEAGFPAESRRRAGIYLTKGERLTIELTKEQLEAVQADEWISVKEADASVSTEDTTLDVDALKRGDLDLVAVELGLDPSKYKNLEELRPAVKEAIAKRDAGETTTPKAGEGTSEGEGGTTTPPAGEGEGSSEGEGDGEGNDDETETTVDLTTKSVEELSAIAKELNIGVTLGEDEAANKALLIKVIEDAKPVEE